MFRIDVFIVQEKRYSFYYSKTDVKSLQIAKEMVYIEHRET